MSSGAFEEMIAFENILMYNVSIFDDGYVDKPTNTIVKGGEGKLITFQDIC